MKLLILGDVNSSHILKWANSLSERNVDVWILSFSLLIGNSSYNNNIRILKISRFNILNINKAIKQINPCIIHAHYATSYGFLLSLIKHKKKILSVWGSDVYIFPKKSFIHKMLLKHNFESADVILSTSYDMKNEISKYSNKSVVVTPFGIDVNVFKTSTTCVIDRYSKSLTIGTVKSVEPVYGTIDLVKSFVLLKKTFPNLKLLIVGPINDSKYYSLLKKILVQSNCADDVIFTGKINYSDITSFYNKIDVFVNLSLNESFGVSVLEAQSCGIPVVVTNVGGLSEVILDKETGFIVHPNNPKEAAFAISSILINENRQIMSQKCRDFVEKEYNWVKSVETMINIYRNEF